MRAAAISVGYIALFLIFALIPPIYQSFFLALYVVFLLGSLGLPFARSVRHIDSTISIYKGLTGAVIGLVGIILYVGFLSTLFQEDVLWANASAGSCSR